MYGYRINAQFQLLKPTFITTWFVMLSTQRAKIRIWKCGQPKCGLPIKSTNLNCHFSTICHRDKCYLPTDGHRSWDTGTSYTNYIRFKVDLSKQTHQKFPWIQIQFYGADTSWCPTLFAFHLWFIWSNQDQLNAASIGVTCPDKCSEVIQLTIMTRVCDTCGVTMLRTTQSTDIAERTVTVKVN